MFGSFVYLVVHCVYLICGHSYNCLSPDVLLLTCYTLFTQLWLFKIISIICNFYDINCEVNPSVTSIIQLCVIMFLLQLDVGLV
jgi:hypothetical protein